MEISNFSVLISTLTILSLLHINALPRPQPLHKFPLYNSNFSNSDLQRNVNSSTLTKGNVSQIHSIFPNPDDISEQIHSTFQSFLDMLNNTISHSPIFGSLRGSIQNISHAPFGLARLDDVDHLVRNVSKLARNSEGSSDMTMILRGIQEAFGDLKRTLLQPRNSNQSEPHANRRADGSSENILSTKGANNARNSSGVNFRRMWDDMSSLHAQIDTNIQESISNARTSLENSVSSIARQGSQIMKERTIGVMSDFQKAFDVFREPFRRFFKEMRSRLPTRVVREK